MKKKTFIQTVAHGVRRQGSNRFGICFMSVADRFDPDGVPCGFYKPTTPAGLGPGAGERSNGGDIAGPVERYDLVSSRQQPPACEREKGGGEGGRENNRFIRGESRQFVSNT